MNLWHEVSKGENIPNEINVIIEIPKNSPNKYEIDKETGLLVKPGDINELKAAIIKLRNYEGLRIRLGDNGRRRAQSEFNWEGQAGKIFDIIAKQ